MQLITHLASLPPSKSGCVATIGNFDGVHLGHRRVIETVAEEGARLGLPRVVLLFEPQPREYFRPQDAPPRLMRLREKLARLATLPVDQAVLLRFKPSFAELSAEEFVRLYLHDRLAIKHLVVGDDFRFGKGRTGNFALLRCMGEQLGFQVADTPSVMLDGERVSSTAIRHALTAGDLDRAARFLGRSYSVCGRIIKGAQLGRTLGFPTANVLMKRKNTPLSGVFAVTMTGVGDRPLPGVANLGLRPTLAGSSTVLLETFLFDFSGDLYGRMVEVSFHRKLRDERRFAGLSELRTQIEKDVAAARAYFATSPSTLQRES